MDRHKIFAVLGTAAVMVLPIVAHSAYGGRPAVQLGLEIASAVLAVLGFTVTKPLVRGGGATGLIGSVDDIEERQVITRQKGRASFEFLLAMAVAVMLALALSGCAGMDLLGLAYKDGSRIATCVPSEYNNVQGALAAGRSGDTAGEVFDWVDVVLQALQCVEPVAKDIYDAAHTKQAVVAGPGGVAPPSQEALRRTHAALVLCRAAQVCK